MFPPASDFMKSLYLFSLILSSHFIRLEPVKILLCGGYDAHPRQTQKAGQTVPVLHPSFQSEHPWHPASLSAHPSGNSPESVQVPDLRLIIKNPGIIQNCFHQSFCPWILPVRVKLYPYFTDPEVYLPVCRKIITAGKQITDKRRIRALPFCKMINFQISRKTYHLSVTPLL